MTTETAMDVGEILLEHRVSAKKYATVSFTVGGAIVVFAVIAGILAANEGVSPGGPAMLFGAIGLAVAGLGTLFLLKGDCDTRFYEHGFQQKTKNKDVTLRFNEIEGFRCWIVFGAAAQIGFRLIPRGADPEDRALPGWTGVNSYRPKADEIRGYLTELFSERMLTALKAGDPVRWGTGRLVPTGIELEGKSIEWKEITRIKIRNNGMAVISTVDQADVTLSIDTLNFWPGYAILQRQLDPAIFQ